MHHTLRSIRTFGLYLLPAFLLATASALLVTLLYSPARVSIAVVDNHNGHSPASARVAALLDNALRQFQAERESRAWILMHRYEQGVLSTEQPGIFQTAPLLIERGDSPRQPVLIRL